MAEIQGFPSLFATYYMVIFPDFITPGNMLNYLGGTYLCMDSLTMGTLLEIKFCGKLALLTETRYVWNFIGNAPWKKIFKIVLSQKE